MNESLTASQVTQRIVDAVQREFGRNVPIDLDMMISDIVGVYGDQQFTEGMNAERQVHFG